MNKAANKQHKLRKGYVYVINKLSMMWKCPYHKANTKIKTNQQILIKQMHTRVERYTLPFPFMIKAGATKPF